ncbi:MAG: hypothetical protein GEEBNDBF_02557 [bacterium]|nr:hypothetical protein [bacterium]
MFLRWCLLLTCLLSLSPAALAKEREPVLMPPTLMESSGDIATELRLGIEEWLQLPDLTKAQQKQLSGLLRGEIAAKLLVVGDARESARQRKKEAPDFGKISRAERLPMQEVLDWGDMSLDTLEDIQGSLKKKLDSVSRNNEMDALRLQITLDRMSRMMTTISNLLKKVADTQEEITQNIK